MGYVVCWRWVENELDNMVWGLWGEQRVLRMILVNLTTRSGTDRATLPSLEMGWDPLNINSGLFA